MKSLSGYNTKIITTPTSVEVWQYENIPVVYTAEKSDIALSENDNKDLKDSEKIEKKEKKADYDSILRMKKYYLEMRWHIARLVDCNFDNKTKFMTLTFKENKQDIEECNAEFKKFLKRLNYYLYNEKRMRLKYIAVWERQKRGAVHYHVIFFDLPYIKNSKLREIWRNGFVKINRIDVDSADNRGRYVSKYFCKELDLKDYKKKAFFTSRNLKKPIVTKVIIDEMNFDDMNVVYQKEYTRKTPNFFGNLLDKDGAEFLNCKVRYTKIKKEQKDYDYDKQD